MDSVFYQEHIEYLLSRVPIDPAFPIAIALALSYDDHRMAADMTEAEIKRCRDAFRMFDKDNSGTIDVWELSHALESSMRQKPSQESVFAMISMVDEDMSGSIDFSEFLKVIQTQKAQATMVSDDSDLIEAFVGLGGDSDKSGSIDYAKLKKIVCDDFGLGIKLDEILKQVSPDNPGDNVDFDEFKAMFALM